MSEASARIDSTIRNISVLLVKWTLATPRNSLGKVGPRATNRLETRVCGGVGQGAHPIAAIECESLTDAQPGITRGVPARRSTHGTRAVRNDASSCHRGAVNRESGEIVHEPWLPGSRERVEAALRPFRDRAVGRHGRQLSQQLARIRQMATQDTDVGPPQPVLEPPGCEF